MILEKKEKDLYFDGCSTVALAEKYGTPLYVLSETAIAAQCDEVKEAFLNKYENTRAAYAAKAFCTLAMCKIVEREGLCIDVVSGGELYTAIKAGFPPERIEFNGNNKLPDELELAVDYGIGRIIIDGLQELSLIEGICARKNKKMNVLYRITPEVTGDTHDYMLTGMKDSKFGIPLDQEVILSAIQAAIRSPWVNFLGFHFHVGSQLHENDAHLGALEVTLQLAKQTKELYGYEIAEINVGGGFSARYLEGEDRKPYGYYLEPIMQRVEAFFREIQMKRPAVVIEPGRSIVAEAGITLYTIGSIKDIQGVRKYVSVDGGMTDNIRPCLYQAEYTAEVVGRMEETEREVVTICGKCCESGDILIRDIALPKVHAGDLLAVLTTGAYGYSMANNYNKISKAAVVLAKAGKDRLIVKRQSYEDQLANELVPEDL